MQKLQIRKTKGGFWGGEIVLFLAVWISLGAGSALATIHDAVSEAENASVSTPAASPASEKSDETSGMGEIVIFWRGHQDIDFGTVRPGEVNRSSIHIGVHSTSSYRESFSWSDFRNDDQVIPENRLHVSIVDRETSAAVANGGMHPSPSSDPHLPTRDVNWQRVDCELELIWSDPVGSYAGFITIEALAM